MENENPEDRLKNLAREALDEIDNLRASIEFDDEYMGNAMSFINDLDAGVRAFFERINSGNYEPGVGELSFMEIVRNVDAHLLPFKHIFIQIEELHNSSK